MMISPESYYEEYLKGKTKEQIMTAIRGLKQEIGRLKKTIENPYAGINAVIHPSEETQIYWSREYLERAKEAYMEAGGKYTLSESEKRAADFNSNMDSIEKITFSIGGYSSYIIELTNGLKAYTKLWEDKEPLSLWDDYNEEPFTKETIIEALKELHIGEWRRRYSTQRFGYMVCDGTQWELEFEYNNGHRPVRFDGDNSYPYNFDKFQMPFGIDAVEDDDE